MKHYAKQQLCRFPANLFGDFTFFKWGLLIPTRRTTRQARDKPLKVSSSKF